MREVLGMYSVVQGDVQIGYVQREVSDTGEGSWWGVCALDGLRAGPYATCQQAEQALEACAGAAVMSRARWRHRVRLLERKSVADHKEHEVVVGGGADGW